MAGKKEKIGTGTSTHTPTPSTSTKFITYMQLHGTEDIKDYGQICETFTIPKMTYVSEDDNESIVVHHNSTSSSFYVSSIDSLEKLFKEIIAFDALPICTGDPIV